MRALTLVAPLLLLAPGAADAASLRCGNRLVSVGDTALELKARCGAPDHVDVQTRLRAEGVAARLPPRTRASRLGVVGQAPATPQGQVGARRPARRPGGRGRVVQDIRYVRETIELWTYAGSAGDLGRVVTVRRGKVSAIETLGKLDLAPDPRCERELASRGARAGVVRLSCGAPQDTARWEEERVIVRPDGVELRELVVHERWTYDPGRGRLLRILHFENGRLVRTETGGRSPS